MHGAARSRACELADYHAKRERFARENPAQRDQARHRLRHFHARRGLHRLGRGYLASVVGVEATAEGRVRMLAASTEIGQGTNTILSQIAAEALGIDYEQIEIAQPDTADVPNSGPTVASRTCMVVGKLVESAAIGFEADADRQRTARDDYTPERFRAGACASYIAKHGALRSFSKYKPPPGVFWDDETIRAMPTAPTPGRSTSPR